MQLTLDGFNSAGPGDEQKWVTWAWDEIKQDVLAIADACDTELIGRKLAIDYIPYWSNMLSQPDALMYEAAKVKGRQKKVVFSKTLRESVWKDTDISGGDLKEEVNKLKSQPGKDLIAYGGGSFAASLIREGLVDEFYLFINPIALGKGVAVFNQLEDWQRLKLINTKAYSSGIVMLHYERN